MKLKDYLIQANISHRSFAKTIGTTNHLVKKWENGLIPHTVLIAKRIEEATHQNVTMDDLIEEAKLRQEEKKANRKKAAKTNE